jgi:hypothetical protein
MSTVLFTGLVELNELSLSHDTFGTRSFNTKLVTILFINYRVIIYDKRLEPKQSRLKWMEYGM